MATNIGAEMSEYAIAKLVQRWGWENFVAGIDRALQRTDVPSIPQDAFDTLTNACDDVSAVFERE